MPTFRATVGQVRQVNENVIELSLTSGTGEFPEFRAGQYVAVGFPEYPVLNRQRPFSMVSSSRDRTRLVLTAKAFGRYSRALWKIRSGAVAELNGPYGSFTLDSTNHPVVLLAGGIGITPFISMIRTLCDQRSSRPVRLAWSVKSAADAVYYDELQQLAAAHPNLSIALFVTDQPKTEVSGCTVGRIDRSVLEQYAESLGPKTKYYICGPVPFSIGMTRHLRNLRVSGSNMKRESFALAPNNILGLDTWLPRFVYVGAVLLLLGILLAVVTPAGLRAGSWTELWAWYLTRAGGLSSYLMLFVMVFVGIGISTSAMYRMFSPTLLWAFHRALGFSLAGAVGVHILGLLLDRFSGLELFEVLVPWLSDSRTNEIALGILGLYLLLTVLASSVFLIVRAAWLWRLGHYFVFPMYVMLLIHGLLLGSDRSAPAVELMYWSTGMIVAAAIAWRIWWAIATYRRVRER